MDVRDWFILFHVNIAGIAATVFLFKHPDTVNFVTWAGLLGTIIGFYQWQTIRDQKMPDAPCQHS
jgi:hypothetical protein